MINRVMLVGRLGKDPDVRFTGTGKAVCGFSLATSERWTDETGQKQERTEWHQIVVWGKQAEHCGQHLNKGDLAAIEGNIRSRTYDDKHGQKRYVTEIMAQRVTFLNAPRESRSSSPVDRPEETSSSASAHAPASDDDIPF